MAHRLRRWRDIEAALAGSISRQRLDQAPHISRQLRSTIRLGEGAHKISPVIGGLAVRGAIILDRAEAVADVPPSRVTIT